MERTDFFGKCPKNYSGKINLPLPNKDGNCTGSYSLQKNGKEKLKEIAMTLMETTTQIPTDIDWIIQVEGHTDKRPIKTSQFPSNWELSTARANSVLKLLLEIGFSPKRLAAAGYGEFYPISDGETKEDYQQNRRIELKLTSR